MVIFAGTNGYGDAVPLERMKKWESDLIRNLMISAPESSVRILLSKKLITPETEQKLAPAVWKPSKAPGKTKGKTEIIWLSTPVEHADTESAALKNISQVTRALEESAPAKSAKAVRQSTADARVCHKPGGAEHIARAAGTASLHPAAGA